MCSLSRGDILRDNRSVQLFERFNLNRRVLARRIRRRVKLNNRVALGAVAGDAFHQVLAHRLVLVSDEAEPQQETTEGIARVVRRAFRNRNAVQGASPA